MKREQNTMRYTGEYCIYECGNLKCRVNLKNCKKGERFIVKMFIGSEHCRGYAHG